jgi:hypothetical protein
MKLGKLTVLSAAALLAGSMTFAVAAESDTMSKGSSATQGKCWDSASNSIKDKVANNASGAKTPGTATTGAAPSAAAPSAAAPSGAASPTAGSSVQRPAAAAGLPNC